MKKKDDIKKKRISIEEQQNLFLSISKKLTKKITAYAIGGTAMIFLGLKDSTLDIDLVFQNKTDKNIFKEAIQLLGYSRMDSNIVYGARDNAPEMLTRGDERFDLFVLEVIDFTFSDSMQKRTQQQTHQFEDNLILKVADPHDIILMKCATGRLKDKDDVRNIINNIKIDWWLIVKEAKKQEELGRDRAIFDLGVFLDSLKREMKIKIPTEILDELWRLLQKQIEEKQNK